MNAGKEDDAQETDAEGPTLSTVSTGSISLRDGRRLTLLAAGHVPSGPLTAGARETEGTIGTCPGTQDSTAPVAPAAVMKLLGHKPGRFLAHLEHVGRGRTGAMETRFYLGQMEGQLVANVMIIEHAGLGILGHVYTVPEYRRLGIAGALCRLAAEDFAARGGRMMVLGTGYGSTAYRLYEKVGFRSAAPESGFMIWLADGLREPADLFPTSSASCETITASFDWQDWPGLTALFALRDGPPLRNLHLRVTGAKNFEGPGLRLLAETAILPDENRRCRAHVLRRTDDGLGVGLATLAPHPLWGGSVKLLDIFIHPTYAGETPRLLASVLDDAGDADIRHVVTYAARQMTGDAPSPSDRNSWNKTARLEAAGWQVEAEINRPWRTLHGEAGEQMLILRPQ